MTLERYSSPEIRYMWDSGNRIHLFFKLWIVTASLLVDAGCLPSGTDQTRERCAAIMRGADADVNNLIIAAKRQEITTGHDVKAALEILVEYTNYGHYHVGMTGRDVSDLATQLQTIQAERLLTVKLVALLKEMQAVLAKWQDVPAIGYTHGQPAQLTTVGRKLGIYFEQLYESLLHNFNDSTVVRPLSGPIGTGVDMDLLLGKKRLIAGVNLDRALLTELTLQMIDPHLVLTDTYAAQGQIYPRISDKDYVGRLVRMGAGLSNLAHAIRLMSSRGVLAEGYPEGRVGSSSMPHKRNPSRSERICGLYHVLCGYEQMLAPVAGSQWEEGDVSCSVVQRVALAGASEALDAMLEQAHVLLAGLELLEQPDAISLYIREWGVLSSLLLLDRAMENDNREVVYGEIKKEISGVAPKQYDDITIRRLVNASIKAASDQVQDLLEPKVILKLKREPFTWMSTTV